MKLFFRGHAYPSVALARANWVFEGQEPVFPTPRPFFQITPGGDGREWKTEQAHAFWRTFAMTDFDIEENVRAFLTRHGSPYNIERGAYGDTASWKNCQRALKPAAEAWEPTIDERVSVPTADPERLRAARSFLEPVFCQGLNIIQDSISGGLAIRATSLYGFMLGSAAIHIGSSVSMTKCEVCNDFMVFGRASARICSAACRNRLAREKKKLEDTANG